MWGPIIPIFHSQIRPIGGEGGKFGDSLGLNHRDFFPKIGGSLFIWDPPKIGKVFNKGKVLGPFLKRLRLFGKLKRLRNWAWGPLILRAFLFPSPKNFLFGQEKQKGFWGLRKTFMVRENLGIGGVWVLGNLFFGVRLFPKVLRQAGFIFGAGLIKIGGYLNFLGQKGRGFGIPHTLKGSNAFFFFSLQKVFLGLYFFLEWPQVQENFLGPPPFSEGTSPS